MKTASIASNGSSLMKRSLLSASTLVGPFALALTLLLPSLSGCNCPEPRYPKYPPVVESPEHVRFVQATIENARAKGVWTAADERAFSHSLPQLSAETRFELGRQIASLINTRAMKVERLAPKGEPPSTCPCGRCDGATVPYQPPRDQTTRDTAGARQTGVQPSAPGATTGPASPAAKQPLQAPPRAP